VYIQLGQNAEFLVLKPVGTQNNQYAYDNIKAFANLALKNVVYTPPRSPHDCEVCEIAGSSVRL
jgi:hypothetical protein